ncbi:MAG TPA: DUF2927 domain-containing protein [Chroococcidiopsis sp.]
MSKWAVGDRWRLGNSGLQRLGVASVVGLWALSLALPADARSGTLSAAQSDAWINIRVFPSLDARVRERAAVGDRVEVLREVTRNGYVWYRIRLADGERLGWVRQDLITLDDQKNDPQNASSLSGSGLESSQRGPVQLPWRIAQLVAPAFLSQLSPRPSSRLPDRPPVLPSASPPTVPEAPSALGFADRDQAIDYFLEIAMGSEFGETSPTVKKWAGPIRITVSGTPTAADLATLDRVIRELNTLINGAVTLEISDQDPNLEIAFLPEAEFAQQGTNYEPGNLGFFWTWWDKDVIDRAKILISTTGVSQKERSHLLREELTQSLGLMNDSERYRDSIFYQGWTSTTDYTELDQAVIAILYRPEIRPGMSADEVKAALSRAPAPGRLTAASGWRQAIAADFSL